MTLPRRPRDQAENRHVTATAGAPAEPVFLVSVGAIIEAFPGVPGRGCGRNVEDSPAQGQLGGTMAIGEEPVMANAVKAGWQDMQKKAPNELAGVQGHHSLAVVVPVILPAKTDPPILESEEPAVGDGDPVGVAAKVGEHLFGAAERPLGKDDPFGRGERFDVIGEGRRLCQMGKVGEELQLPGVKGISQPLQEEPAEQA